MARVGRSAAATAAVLVAILMAAAFPEPARASHSTEELSGGGRIGWPAFLVSESPAPSSPDDAGAIDVADAFPDAAAPSQQPRPAAAAASASGFLTGARRAGPAILP